MHRYEGDDPDDYGYEYDDDYGFEDELSRDEVLFARYWDARSDDWFIEANLIAVFAIGLHVGGWFL